MDLVHYLLKFIIVALSTSYVTKKPIEDQDVLAVAGVSTAGFYLLDMLTARSYLEPLDDEDKQPDNTRMYIGIGVAAVVVSILGLLLWNRLHRQPSEGLRATLTGAPEVIQT